MRASRTAWIVLNYANNTVMLTEKGKIVIVARERGWRSRLLHHECKQAMRMRTWGCTSFTYYHGGL